MDKLPPFIPGLKLSELFYHEAVKPVLAAGFPHLHYSAGLIGSGSEVLGLDTPQSMDHNWGPRLQLFVGGHGFQETHEKIHALLSESLPRKFHGYPTNFTEPQENGSRLMKEMDSGPTNHHVEIHTVASFFNEYLGHSTDKDLTAVDWLTIPEQRLLAITSGKIFYDGLDELELVRKKYNYYPNDVWLYLLNCQWTKLSQEEAFVGRCAQVGDELGSKLVAARIVYYVMRLCFLMERTYAPYMKWFGKSFSKLRIAGELGPVLGRVLSAEDYPEREASLAKAYGLVATAHNNLGITPPLPTKVSPFYERPFQVIHAGIFAAEIKKQIKDPVVKQIAVSNIGSIDQFIDSTDVLDEPAYFDRLKTMYSK